MYSLFRSLRGDFVYTRNHTQANGRHQTRSIKLGRFILISRQATRGFSNFFNKINLFIKVYMQNNNEIVVLKCSSANLFIIMVFSSAVKNI